MSESEKKSIFRKMGGYSINRVQPKAIREASRDSLRSGGGAALKALKPAKLDTGDIRDGLSGRYADGGKARFAEMVAQRDLSEDDLSDLVVVHLRDFRIYGLLAGIFLLIAILLIALTSAQFSAAGGIILSLFSLGAFARAIQSDFAAYQIRQRAFCGFNQYLKRRNP